jgi:hypothetical protein
LILTSSGRSTTLEIIDTGSSGANIKLTGNGATTPGKSIRAFNGKLEIVNDGYGSVIFSITNSGTATATSFTGAGTGLTGTAASLSIGGNAATVTTNANLTGEVTSVGNAATVSNAAILGKVLTGFVSGAGTVSATDNLLQSIQKLDGNTALKANLASPTFTGTVTLPIGSIAPGILGSTSPTVTAAGTTQGTATSLTTDINIVTTATVNQGVMVPGATSGKYAVIINKTAVTIIVYPSTGHNFDSLAANVGISLLAGAFLEIYGYSNTQWGTTYQALTQGQFVVGNIAGNAATVTTNANLTGEVTSVGNAATVSNAAVISKVITGYASSAGTVAATDTLLQAVQKLDGNTALKASIVSEQNSASHYLGSVSGTNTITASLTPTLTAYSAGQTFEFVASATNTGPVTINIDSVGASPITKNGTQALFPGDIVSGQAYILIRDAAGNFQLSNTATLVQAGGVIFENSTVIAANYTLTAGKNGHSIGPITINTGITLTIPTGARYIVL